MPGFVGRFDTSSSNQCPPPATNDCPTCTCSHGTDSCFGCKPSMTGIRPYSAEQASDDDDDYHDDDNHDDDDHDDDDDYNRKHHKKRKSKFENVDLLF